MMARIVSGLVAKQKINSLGQRLINGGLSKGGLGQEKTVVETVKDGVNSGTTKHSIEQVLDKVKSYEQARNKALKKVGDLGINSKPYICRLKTSKGFGKITGRISSDDKIRWYLDYDPIKGTHINVHDFRQGKGLNAKKYAIPFEGTE